MARAALSVVFDQGRDDELVALRARIDALKAEQWDVICRGLLRFRADFDDSYAFQYVVRSMIADYVIEEGWCLAEGVTGRFNTSPGRLNFHVDSHGHPLHIESLLANRLTVDLMRGTWHPLRHYLRYIAECGTYTPSEGMFYQGSAPPRAAEEYNRW
jgi:hypothetical protein